MTEGREAPFLAALRALRDGLESLGAPWMVLGGVAVIARGVPRHTVDIDATVWAAAVAPERALEVLGRYGIVPRIADPIGFARRHQVLPLRHEPSGVPLDVSLAWLPFEDEAIRAAEACDFAGVPVRLARPDDLITYKLVAARARDLEDVEKLLLLHGPTLDVQRIARVVREFSDVLEDRTRIDALERLLRQTGLAQ